MTALRRLERANTRLGVYSLVRPISTSEVSSDYLAVMDDGGPQRYCELKIVRPSFTRRDKFESTFFDAVDTFIPAEHPHLMRVLERGRIDGQYYVVSEHVPGTTLRAIQTRLTEEGETLPLACVLWVALGVARALHRLSMDERVTPFPPSAGREVVHGDLSLDRIRISTAGDVKLEDFSIELAVRATSREAYRSERDQHRTVRDYGRLCIEQLLDRADHRSDQYALGAAMFELVTGRTPYERADVASTVAAVLGGEPPDVRRGAPTLPADIAGIVRRALARRPEARFASTAAMYADIEAVAAEVDLASAPSLLGGLARGLNPPPEALTSPGGPASSGAAADGLGESASGQTDPVDPAAMPPAASIAESPSDDGEADGSSSTTIALVAAVTAATIVTIFLWIYLLGR